VEVIQATILLLVFLVFGALLIVIPGHLGREAGLWVVKKHRLSWEQIGVNPLPWWGTIVIIWLVEIIITLSIALGAPMLPERPFFPFYIYRVLLGQQLVEHVFVMVYSILMITAFFIASYVRILLRGRSRPKENPDQRTN